MNGRWLERAAVGLLLATTAGCGQRAADSAARSKASATTPANKAKPGDDEHGHKPGSHGGIIVAIGGDNYHAEAVFEKGGTVRLHMLGKDETSVAEVEAQSLKAFVKAAGDAEHSPIAFEPDVQAGDSPNKTSAFVAKIPAGLAGKPLLITVPSIRIDGLRYRMAFESKSEAAHQQEMPAKVVRDEERKLYLTPGGLYTKQDIQANGNVTASQKFADFEAAHDLKPKIGDKICPVTLTKANPKCNWTVGGKSYEFCCPPCVDEFMKLAKEQPAEIKAPEAYVKK